jgi:ParB/RepB/Spo0J family partition protein
LRENTFNPNEMNSDKLAELETSMKKDGQQQPILVRVWNSGVTTGDKPTHVVYEIIDGAHRFAIAKKLGWESVKVIVQDIDEATARRICYKVNEARGSLDFFKQAKFFQTALEGGAKLGSLSKDYGVSEKFLKERQQLAGITQEEHEGILSLAKKNQSKPDANDWLLFASLSTIERKEAIKIGKAEKYGCNYSWLCRHAKETLEEAKTLALAVEKAEFKTCPVCKGPAKEIAYGGNFECEKGHDWSPKTGKVPQTGLENDKPKAKEKKQVFQRTYKVEGAYAAARKVLFDMFKLPIALNISRISIESQGTLEFSSYKDDASITIEGFSAPFKGFWRWYVKFSKDGNTVVPDGALDKNSDAQIRKVIELLNLKVIEKKKKGAVVSVGHAKAKVKRAKAPSTR